MLLQRKCPDFASLDCDGMGYKNSDLYAVNQVVTYFSLGVNVR